LRDLWYDAMNKANFDDIALWENYRSRHPIKDNWDKFQEFVTSDRFR